MVLKTLATLGLATSAVSISSNAASISGSGSADTAAMSSIMLPQMKKRKYNIDFSAAIMACSGSLGTIIPPSIMMVVLATISNQSVGALFLAGIIPGLICALFLLISGYLRAKTNVSESKDYHKFSKHKHSYIILKSNVN